MHTANDARICSRNLRTVSEPTARTVRIRPRCTKTGSSSGAPPETNVACGKSGGVGRMKEKTGPESGIPPDFEAIKFARLQGEWLRGGQRRGQGRRDRDVDQGLRHEHGLDTAIHNIQKISKQTSICIYMYQTSMSGQNCRNH